MPDPTISRTLNLTFVGDWGQANFHRICSWICQEICDRAGPRSRVAILSHRDGGLDALRSVNDGEAHLCLATPAMLLPGALAGEGFFAGRPMPGLRALAVLPQNDRILFAVSPSAGVESFAEIRERRTPLRIATSGDDGTNFIGHVAARYLAAHGLDEATVTGWGGAYLKTVRPEQSLALLQSGEADAVVQEAITTPWWAGLLDTGKARLVPSEPDALAKLERDHGFLLRPLPAGFWDSQTETLEAVDFSDFVIVVRDDLPDDIAYLLAWIITETREKIERTYRHLAPKRSPLSYPLDPVAMARTSLPLHPAAERYYRDAGHLA